MMEMKCKNCQTTFAQDDKFCKNCGGKIVTKRLTLKRLINDSFLKALGWDNKYLQTVINLIIRPQKVVNNYIDGVRKRFIHPIGFFAIGMTLLIIGYNVYQKEYLELTGATEKIIEQDEITAINEINNNPNLSLEEKEQELVAVKFGTQFTKSVPNFYLKYFNVLSFLFLPLYALISWLVFWKRNNYAEHLVINAYLQGILFLFSLINFIICVNLGVVQVYIDMLLSVLFYTYAYSRIYNLGVLKSIGYFLKFILILLALAIVGIIITTLMMFILN